MSLTKLPSALRMPALPNIVCQSCVRRSLHTTPPQQASILFALSSLSNSRETQHFNKISRLPRVEHSPPLKLIKNGEVDPYPLPTPPRPAPASEAWNVRRSRSALRIWDDKALKIGRVLLVDQARQTHRMQRALERTKRREARQDAMTKKDRLAWQKEANKLRSDMRVAGTIILFSIGTATALASWRFWPQTQALNSGGMGRKMAARAAAAMPLPAAVSTQSMATLPVAAAPAVPRAEKTPSEIPPKPSPEQMEQPKSWWNGLFWKQH